jgi:outer membrane protein TolC
MALATATPNPAIRTDVPLTLQDAVRIAEENHADVVVAQESVRAAHERVTEARSGNRPFVSGSVSYNVRGITVPNRGSGAGFNGTRSNFITDPGLQPAVTLDYPILDGGLTRANVRQAIANVLNNQAGLVTTRNNLAFDVAQNFMAQLRAQSLLTLRSTQERLAQEQLSRVEARIAVGSSAEVERALPLSEFKNRQVDRIAAENDVRVAANALRNVLGLPVGPALQLTEPTETAQTLPAIEDLRLEANRLRPEVVQAQAQVRVAEESVKIAHIQRNPRLDTVVNAGITPTSNSQRASWAVGAQISMPIFDAGLSKARIREAEAGVVSAQARLTQSQKDVAAEVEEAYYNLINARDRLGASQQAVEAAQANLEAAQTRYELGITGISVVDLISSQVEYDTANTNAIQARYDVYLAQAQLDRAIGRLPTGA